MSPDAERIVDFGSSDVYSGYLYGIEQGSDPSAGPAPVARMVPFHQSGDGQAQDQSTNSAPVAIPPSDAEPRDTVSNEVLTTNSNGIDADNGNSDVWRRRIDNGLRNLENLTEQALNAGADPFESISYTAAGFYEDEEDESDDESAESFHFPQPSHPMSLRRNVTQSHIASGLDCDESGDYDPNAKPAPPKPARKKSPSSERCSSEDREPRTQLPPTETEIRQLGHQYCIALPIHTKKGRQRLKELHEQYGDNWPDESVQLFVPINVADLPAQTYAFRQRKQQDSQTDKEYYLRNTPAGRGCKHCYEIGHHCSMTEPAGSYPCTACSESNEVCELLVQPKRKHACENCLSQKEPCSYTQDIAGDHISPCTRCEFKGLTCVARPAYDPLRTRLDADGKPATPVPPVVQQQKDYSREYKTCAPCRRNNRWCSLTDGKKGNEPPCSTCRKQGTPCTFEAVPRVLRQPNENPNKRRRQSHKGDRQDHTVKTITTSISHPVTFLSSTVTNKGLHACHWCLTDNPFYALHGHGERRQVKVLVWPNGAGYEELEGGHTNDGCEPSRMCHTCTTDRVAILTCPGHALRPLPGFTEEINGDMATRDRLPYQLVKDLMGHAGAAATAANARALRTQHQRWCAMCPNAAQFACRSSTPPPSQSNSAEARSADIRILLQTETVTGGCGLRLCWVCACLLRSDEICGADLQKLVKSLDNSAPREYYTRGLRADFDFLSKDGPLWRQVENLRIRYGGTLPDLG